MSLVHTKEELKKALSAAGRGHKTLGLVPTMGYLHEGHLSLIRKAKAENDLVAVSVFVNPTQFAPGEDFESYPRDIGRDYELAAGAGADFVFNPPVGEIYPEGASTAVEVTGEIPKKLCGASRPTHFKGVTTVVSILFHIVGPDRAYFGQKDAQQAVIIQKMVRDLHMPLEVVVCPIVREADGLAMSSRNIYLSPEERRQATVLNRALGVAEDYLRSGAGDRAETAALRALIVSEIETSPLAKIDYVEVLAAGPLQSAPAILPGKPALAAVAVRFGKTRLIDNRILSV
jgi:pantoate--beta-alanine ligase